MASILDRLAPLFRFSSRINPTLLSAVLAIALLFFSTFFALRYVQGMQERIVREHLLASLNSFTELIGIWQQQNLGAVAMLANTNQAKLLLKQVLLEQGANPDTHTALREWLYPILRIMGFDGFAVVNHERILIAGTTNSYLQQPATAPETLEVLNKVLHGKAAISRPVVVPRDLDGPRGVQRAGTLMQHMCVLFESEVTAPAYFCVRINTQASFFPLFLKGRIGGSGEIYAIDRYGGFVTPPRFSTSGEQVALSTVDTFIPGAPVPPTIMTDFVVNREAGFIRMGYEDYRGVLVAGTGRWLEDMGLGIIVEQDVAEAMAPYYAARNIILALSLGASALILLLTLSAILNRRRLAAREGLFRSLLDNLPPPVHITSMTHQVIAANPAFCELLGIARTELLGRNIYQLPVPAWLKPLVEAEEQITGESYYRDFVFDVLDPQDTPRYFRIVRFPVVYSQGQAPQAMACIWVDATERVVANQQLELINQNLEQLVDERTHELMIAKDAALAATQTKADFLANMSHEIRTPLNAIIGLAHVALASQPELKLRTYLEKMRGSGEHLLQVINDILNFSRMEAGKLKLDNNPFSVDQLIDKTLDLTWEKAAAKGLTMHADLDPSVPPTLLGDSLRLGQILINFCANAVKFTDQGSVTIRVAKVRDWQDKVELLFEVIDTGIGIAADQLPKLFQPFEQVDASSTRRFEGTGLGLSICKNLAELMQAQIYVKSTLGQGSCFCLRITLDKQHTSLADDAAAASHSISGKINQSVLHCKVLVVEDNLLNQEIILSLLEAMGAEVICVGSGPEAIATVVREQLDLILMDIQLPGMDGVEASLRIRALEKARNVPIIAVTANALPGDREHYLAMGMDDYLAKPIDPEQLRRLLERWHRVAHSRAAELALAVPSAAVLIEPAPDKVEAAPASPFELLQQGGVEVQQALGNLMYNEPLYHRLLARFARERANFADEFAQLLVSDQSAALNQVHSLKSLAASLGMPELAQVCAQLEELLRADSQVDETLNQLTSDLRRELGAKVSLVLQALAPE